jgi:signal transduction histidine kinase
MTLDYDIEVRRISAALSEIAHALESADGMSERVHRTLALTQAVVPYQRCSLLHVGSGAQPDLFVVPSVALAHEEDSLLSTLLRIFRLLAEGGETGPSHPTPHLALPVMGLDEVIGVVRVEPDEQTAYDARHLRLLSVVAAQLGAYLTMIRLRDEDRRQTKELALAHEFQQLMLGVVGHDLRNPLAVIATVAEQLLKKTDDPQQARKIERALRNAERANRIIGDLLDVTRLRVTGQIPVLKQRVDLLLLLKELVDDFNLQHSRIELRSSATAAGEVDCDPVRLSQLLANLINNALTHGQGESPVQVEFRFESNDVVISVHNRGPAIPDQLLPTIFDPFRQGAAKPPAERAGFGLGLYIVDQIARAHGGGVVARSSEALGTTFTVTFPRWHETAMSVAPNTMLEDSAQLGQVNGEATEGTSEPMVLVVDDDPDIRDTMAQLLEQHAYTVATAANGAEALALLRAGLRPKLVLLDLWMPVMDGETFYAIVREDPTFSEIPICVISADAARAVRLTKSDTSAFLEKPVQLEDLLQALERVAH